jgi:aldehyde dehydrogenase
MSTAAVEIQNAIFEEAFVTIRQGGVRSRYDNSIGGKWVAPLLGKYFTDHSPINGAKLAEFATGEQE